MSHAYEHDTVTPLAIHDPVWERIREDASRIAQSEPALAGFIHATILDQPDLESAISQRVAHRLGDASVGPTHIRHAFRQAFEARPELSEILRVDVVTVYDRDPACHRLIDPVLYFKGFHAIQTHRLANYLWHEGRRDFAYYLQSRSSSEFQVDIHPAVPMGRGIFIDHATGVIVGETAVIEDDVSILQGVTLGGTGKEDGDRHPKIRHGVLVGAHAAILGNIEVGNCARVAAGSVVLKPVPPKSTVAGVPARVVGTAGCAEPARSMDQILADFDERA
ncbi:serine O-acetyltransferase [Amorphus orientalis]|uniref:Serine acetyltransferase n=1 Tax=Amorphus orientalis TaxID=649198 RepID=A0AAE3VPJ4_9HYPH|nr:serine O-acetyltransferase [Amorphus orientalis]MDQ0315742.1 serine O-acetyltransferase [Amorphus orientalis]